MKFVTEILADGNAAVGNGDFNIVSQFNFTTGCINNTFT